MKNLTLSKRIFLEWALEKYGEGVKFEKRGVVDFTLPTGDRVIVKRPVGKYIYFTRRQWEGLRGSDLVAVVTESSGVLGVVPFRNVASTRVIVTEGGKFWVTVEEPGRAVLVVRCSRETYERFKKISSMFRSDEDALNYLLDAYEVCGTKPLKPRAF